jgi:endonuclease YncB( thermonuclease family)
MHASKAVNIRLDGIDPPERGQDFGTRARQL